MNLPFELMEIIYYLSDIDHQLIFRKLFPPNSFRSKKIIIDSILSSKLSNLYSIQIHKYNHFKSLKINLLQHNLLQQHL